MRLVLASLTLAVLIKHTARRPSHGGTDSGRMTGHCLSPLRIHVACVPTEVLRCGANESLHGERACPCCKSRIKGMAGLVGGLLSIGMAAARIHFCTDARRDVCTRDTTSKSSKEIQDISAPHCTSFDGRA